MAVTGTAQLSIPLVGLTTGSKTVAPAAVAITNGIGQISDVALVVGNLTVTVPAGTTLVTIAFPITTATVKFKGVAGDTGTTLISNPSIALFATFPCKDASFVLNSDTIISIEISFA